MYAIRSYYETEPGGLGGHAMGNLLLAALLGTGVELVFPVLLAIGLGTRASAAVLFAFNRITSYNVCYTKLLRAICGRGASAAACIGWNA